MDYSVNPPYIPSNRPQSHDDWVKALAEQRKCFVGAHADIELNDKIKHIKNNPYAFNNPPENFFYTKWKQLKTLILSKNSAV